MSKFLQRSFERLVKIQKEANDLLKEAILDERSRVWEKVIFKYKKMLKMISRSNLGTNFKPPPSYSMLQYESFYHLGMALQNVGRHMEAVQAYNHAMWSMDLKKSGCSAGCRSKTCFHTPLFAKRSFAFAKLNQMSKALRDIDQAIVLDSKNPDLYCVRSLMWNGMKNREKALEDANQALKIKQDHVCALLLRGGISQRLKSDIGSILEGLSLTSRSLTINNDQKKAISRSPDASAYLDVTDLHHPNIIRFWNRLLWSLNVPRTVVCVDLISPLINHLAPSSHITLTNVQCSIDPVKRSEALRRSETAGGRRERRLSYSEAIRCYAHLRKGSRKVVRSSTSHSMTSSAPSSAIRSHLQLPAKSKRSFRVKDHQEAAKYASRLHDVIVFSESRVGSGAPRMYRKPWSGDKLLVHPRKDIKKSEIFRV